MFVVQNWICSLKVAHQAVQLITEQRLIHLPINNSTNTNGSADFFRIRNIFKDIRPCKSYFARQI